jgi:hypothetical protein
MANYFIRELSLLVVFILASVPFGAAATEAPISSDRPGQAIGADVVAPGVLQVQTGLNAAGTDRDSDLGFTHSTGLRLGLGQRFELNVLTDLGFDQGASNDLYGVRALDFGLRAELTEWSSGKLTSEATFRSFLGRADLAERNPSARLRLVLSQSLGQTGFALLSNLGFDDSGAGNGLFAIYALNLSFSWGDRGSVFVENYGNTESRQFSTCFDAGIGYLLGPDVQLDLSAGVGRNRGLVEYFVDGGVSFRLDLWSSGRKS